MVKLQEQNPSDKSLVRVDVDPCAINLNCFFFWTSHVKMAEEVNKTSSTPQSPKCSMRANKSFTWEEIKKHNHSGSRMCQKFHFKIQVDYFIQISFYQFGL